VLNTHTEMATKMGKRELDGFPREGHRETRGQILYPAYSVTTTLGTRQDTNTNMAARKPGRLELDVEKCRAEGNWTKAMELVRQLERGKHSGLGWCCQNSHTRLLRSCDEG